MEITIDGAKGVLFNIIGGADMTMNEVDEAAKIISAAADPDARIIFGATIDETMIDQIKITVIATGFDENRQRLKDLRYQPGGTFAPGQRYGGPVGRVSDDSAQQQTQPQQQQVPVADEPVKPAQPQNSNFDEFGEDFEIPAFLRKGK